MEFAQLTIPKIHEKLLKKYFSAQEIARFFLDKIKKEDKNISSFLLLTENLAISQAKEVDTWISEKKDIPLLSGVPLAVKDLILVKGEKCTAASKILENYIAPYDATVVKRLKEQGCLILGKTNLDEFAMGSSTENSAFGPTRNPSDTSRVSGGSSGGSAAALAANFCTFALGSDTGGSIRQPASFCGVVGLKPTYGAVSRFGLMAMASSLDQIGPFAKTVEDAKIVFDAISGKDPLDSTSIEPQSLRLPAAKSSQKLIIGVPKEYFGAGMDKGVEDLVRGAIEKFGKEGFKIEEISLPHTEYALSTYYIIMPSEVSANLARYDGIKYGFSKAKDLAGKKGDLLDVYCQSRAQGFGKEVRRRIMLGTYALSVGYYEAYYLRAQKVRTLIKKDFEKAFQKVDLIFTPVTPTPAFKIGEKISDPLTMYLSDIFTIAVNLAGLPAISIPCGRVDNLPVGLQMIARPFEENLLFEFGQIFERIR